MNFDSSVDSTQFDLPEGAEERVLDMSQNKESDGLKNIYHTENNIVIWQRDLSDTLKMAVDRYLRSNPKFQASISVSSENAMPAVLDALGDDSQTELSQNIAQLVKIFCGLFELDQVELRLVVIDQAMCPKFHVDKVICRLLTTFQGIATEWLPHDKVNRDKLGLGSQGKSDNESGLYKSEADIQRLSCGDIALLKGELWRGNESRGLVHRSPSLSSGELRLLLTIDFGR